MVMDLNNEWINNKKERIAFESLPPMKCCLKAWGPEVSSGKRGIVIHLVVQIFCTFYVINLYIIVM